jgi:hypothetical protein
MEIDWVLEGFKEGRGFFFLNLICRFFMFFLIIKIFILR